MLSEGLSEGLSEPPRKTTSFRLIILGNLPGSRLKKLEGSSRVIIHMLQTKQKWEQGEQ